MRGSPTRRGVLGIGLLLLACLPARADEVCAPHVEEHPGWQSASLRPHTDAFRACTLSEPRYREVVSAWLQGMAADAPVLKSLSLGRAVDLPWISRRLARAGLSDPGWDACRGRARQGDPNAWVAAVLAEPAFLERLQAPFQGTAYRVTKVSVEKVLVGPATEILPDAPAGRRVPFDAQLWLVLAPAQSAGAR